MQTLYEISNDLRDVYNKLENGEGIDENGELNPELITALQVSENNLKAKGIDIGYVIKSFDDEIAIYEREIKRLTDRKRALQNTQERIKERLISAMQEFGIIDIKGQTLKVSLRKSECVEIDNVDLLDDKFKRVKVEADKTAIKNAIKEGEQVVGARIVQKDNLQIK